MNLKIYVLLFALVLSAFSYTAALAEDDAKAIERARALFEMIRQQKFDDFVANSDATMQKVLPADQVKQAWDGMTGTFGGYQREIRASSKKQGVLTVVDLISKFEHGAINVQLTLDQQSKAAGLYFIPTSEGIDYEPPSYVDSARFVETKTKIDAGGFPLDAFVTMPKADGLVPVVVFVHGSGAHDEDETIFSTKPFRDLAWGLASRGVGSIRYVKRTKAYPMAVTPDKITIEHEISDDAIAAAKLMMNRKDVSRVFLLGHSLGATAAPYIAERESRLAGLILLAGAARPIEDLVLDQVTYIANSDGEVSDEEKTQIKQTREAVEKLRSGKVEPSDTLLGVPAVYWQTLHKLRPTEIASSLTLPMLIMQGGRDYQVTEADLNLWKKALDGRKNVTFKKFAKMDHLFHKGSGPSTPSDYQEKGYVDESVIKYIARWIEKNSR